MKLINQIKRLLGVKLPSSVFKESLGEMIDINEFVEKKKAPAEMQTVNKGEDSQKLSYPNCTIDEFKSQVVKIITEHGEKEFARIMYEFILLNGGYFDLEEFYRYIVREYGGDKSDS